MRKGFTPPTQGVGSRISCPVAGFVSGHQCPGAVFGAHCEGPNRPSPARAAIIASAAALPEAIPCVLNGESGIAASESAYCVASESRTLCFVGNGMLAGTVETMFERTVYAAVATAASGEAVAAKRRFSR